MDDAARIEARKQWNARACGELPGDKVSIDYFDAVEQDRHRQQPWMYDYFGYERFAGQHVLEIGTGQGTDLMRFAKAGAICHGVDITQNHLELTAANATLRGIEVDLHEADATCLPFADNSMDCVYSFGVLHHIPEINKVIGEIYRILKPGGVVMIACYHKWSVSHLFWLLKGLCNGELFTKGYDGLLATIEKGADGVTVKPYVRLFSKSEIRCLMKAFVPDDLSIHQVYFGQSFIGRVLWNCLKRLEQHIGWYVTYQGHKPKESS